MTGSRSPFDLSTCARPNILALEPYRCARDDYKDDGTNILLDANENAYGPGLDISEDGKLSNGAVNGHVDCKMAGVDLLGLHRYPDPTLSSDPSIKIVYVCSPGNPTANLVSKSDLQQILEHATWNGVVVLDEAYIDFAPEGSSLAEWVLEWPNLVVMQTLSKAFGLAGIRLGAAFTSPAIAGLLNNFKAPYNISSPTSALACAALQPKNLAVMKDNREMILTQRLRMLEELPKISGVGSFLGGAESNFLLVEILDRPRSQGGQTSNNMAMAVYERLAETKGVVVRFRGKEVGCLGCLRITVGTEKEVNKLLAEMKAVLGELMSKRDGALCGSTDNEKEHEANDVIA
ncbi:hypothetical protein P7C71_g1251, partial [Lecanoromycetidae sp. Uapishka_2]